MTAEIFQDAAAGKWCNHRSDCCLYPRLKSLFRKNGGLKAKGEQVGECGSKTQYGKNVRARHAQFTPRGAFFYTYIRDFTPLFPF